MLIEALINLGLGPDITALSWVDRYGGVVQTFKDVTGMNTEGDAVIKRFPVSCAVNQADCNNNQFYQALVPDSSKSSIVYWEVISGMSDSGQQQSTEVIRRLQGTVRLVGWINKDRLGLTGCNSAADAIMSLWAIIKRKRIVKLTTPPYDNSTLYFRVSQEVNRDANIFGNYDYPTDWNYLFHPYDYFALDVEVRFETCFPTYDVPTGTEIVCTDYTRL